MPRPYTHPHIQPNIRPDDNNPVYVVGHHDEGVDPNAWMVLRYCVPRLLHGPSGGAQPHVTVHNLTEYTCPVPGADGDETGARPGIVVAPQPD